jgi:hypothetical protein
MGDDCSTMQHTPPTVCDTGTAVMMSLTSNDSQSSNGVSDPDPILARSLVDQSSSVVSKTKGSWGANPIINDSKKDNTTRK